MGLKLKRRNEMEEAIIKKNWPQKNNIISESGAFIDVDSHIIHETSGENITQTGLDKGEEIKKQIMMVRKKKTYVMRDSGNSVNLTKQWPWSVFCIIVC
jgi:RecJ-like exonuclease